MENWNYKWLLSLLLILAFGGCSTSLTNMMAEKLGYAPSRPNVTRISLPPQSIVKDSFSLLPLNEDGWIVGGQSNDALLLGARGTVPGETRIITAFVRPLSASITGDDFLAYAKSVKRIDSPNRLEVLRQDAQKDNSTGKDCVKIHTTLKDSAPQVVTQRADSMMIDSLYWVCKHPHEDKAIIVEYSDRFYAGNEETDFEEKAEAVFHGLQFIIH
jgi:hypothetical protein